MLNSHGQLALLDVHCTIQSMEIARKAHEAFFAHDFLLHCFFVLFVVDDVMTHRTQTHVGRG